MLTVRFFVIAFWSLAKVLSSVGIGAWAVVRVEIFRMAVLQYFLMGAGRLFSILRAASSAEFLNGS